MPGGSKSSGTFGAARDMTDLLEKRTAQINGRNKLSKGPRPESSLSESDPFGISDLDAIRMAKAFGLTGDWKQARKESSTK